MAAALDYLPVLATGAWLTLQLALYSTILGAILAFVLGTGSLSSRRWKRYLSVTFVEFFRGTSLLVQLFWLYFALPLAGDLVGVDLRFSPFAVGVLALSLNIGAYAAEVVRGAVAAVPTSQYEAAKALDFSPAHTLWRIIIPQALPEMMPSLTNLAVQNVKDTALVSLISLADLAYQAEQIRNVTQDSTTIYSLLLVMYFAMALMVVALMTLLTRVTQRWQVK